LPNTPLANSNLGWLAWGLDPAHSFLTEHGLAQPYRLGQIQPARPSYWFRPVTCWFCLCSSRTLATPKSELNLPGGKECLPGFFRGRLGRRIGRRLSRPRGWSLCLWLPFVLSVPAPLVTSLSVSFLFRFLLPLFFFVLSSSSGFVASSAFYRLFLRKTDPYLPPDTDLHVDIELETPCFGWIGTPTVLPLLDCCWWFPPRLNSLLWRRRKRQRTEKLLMEVVGRPASIFPTLFFWAGSSSARSG